MMEKSLRIVFMGTPDFAVPTLKALLESRHKVVGVITSVDKPAGRGRKIRYSGVKQFFIDQGLEEKGIKLMQPPNLKRESFHEELSSCRADLQVVVAFRMLPEVVWNMPPHGTLNLHASLLPAYRGAAPINWAIMNGEVETGLTTFLLQHAIDTGNLLEQVKIEITAEDTAGSLHDRMMESGGELVVRTVDKIADGNFEAQPQDLDSEFPKAPKLNPENTHIDWNRPAAELRNFIRGLSPYPSAWTKLHDKKLKVFKAEIVEQSALQLAAEKLEETSLSTAQPGQFHFTKLKEEELWCKSADGWLRIELLQMEGKRRMNTADFLRGYQDRS